ncbi:hypothetical protein [Amycolatopsis sp. H20-H5]|uniref:hypothetical protein n=1 Tax=Amycolatopsis sp. H20-H5 TaxID=3046309 RepID=UPI002DBC6BAE|nr:hypothetical protein [Amycolatopsis sp. H20-H5]MEC3980494.1 hypothetical protein [Amycolatopsis sp. H20-H5]
MFSGRLADVVVAAEGTRGAETAKLLENTDRFVNIVLINEITVFRDRVPPRCCREWRRSRFRITSRRSASFRQCPGLPLGSSGKVSRAMRAVPGQGQRSVSATQSRSPVMKPSRCSGDN